MPTTAAGPRAPSSDVTGLSRDREPPAPDETDLTDSPSCPLSYSQTPSAYRMPVLFCFLAVVDPTVGQTMDLYFHHLSLSSVVQYRCNTPHPATSGVM